MTRAMRHQLKLIAAGKCASCSRSNPKGGWRCDECNRVRRIRDANRRQQRAASSECLICGKPITRFVKCLKCRRAQAASDRRYAARRAA